MKKLLLALTICCSTWLAASAQYAYTASPTHPFGLPNPEAPEQLLDFAPMIGSCPCTSEKRNPDGTWVEPESIIWNWKYIMNGMGVQDETLKPDGSHGGSIRQFNVDSARWYVHWYSTTSVTPRLSTWEGTKKDSTIQLYREQAAPNGTPGYFRLTFYNMREEGYDWIGEWVNVGETIVYPTWKISCLRE